MKIEYTKSDAKKAEFVVGGIDFRQANAIRRAAMAYVPSMAIDSVTVYENTSALYEEMIVHRLGMIPLTTDLKTYSTRDTCKCKGKGCGVCQVSLILDKSGPGIVYSGDLKSQDPKVKPVLAKIPIVKLRENQKMKMEMTARLGYMSEHAKYQPGIAAYSQKKDGEFEFFVESYNNLTPKEMLDVGLGALEEKAAALESAYEAKVLKKKK